MRTWCPWSDRRVVVIDGPSQMTKVSLSELNSHGLELESFDVIQVPNRRVALLPQLEPLAFGGHMAVFASLAPHLTLPRRLYA